MLEYDYDSAGVVVLAQFMCNSFGDPLGHPASVLTIVSVLAGSVVLVGKSWVCCGFDCDDGVLGPVSGTDRTFFDQFKVIVMSNGVIDFKS
ncbi:hypothetical protein B586_19935 [Mycobacterium haemophilum DSM 44634]|nr:hypothetical protein B586_19935 [Mycobacterium haemophilum DSM 44634]